MTQEQLISFEDFQRAAKHCGIEISERQLSCFKKYYEILLDWNKKINLISRKQGNILEKHFLDSILFLGEIKGLISHIPQVFDIGSGGGFPGVPLAIMEPIWFFTLCESVAKKSKFLDCLITELELNNVKVINARVESVHKQPQYKHKFDLVTARAVEKLDELIKYVLPLLKENSYLLAYKAKDIEDEIKGAQKIIEKNNLTLKIFSKEVGGVERKLVAVCHCEEGKARRSNPIT